MRRSKLLLPVLLLTLAVFALGCSDDDENPTVTAPMMGSGVQLRAVHASPDAPNVDIYAKGISTPLVTNLGYGETTPYLDLAAGTYNIELRAAGSPASSAPAFETGDLTLADDDVITALAVGLLGSTDAADKFRVLPLIENFVDPGAGNAAVRIIHGSSDAPTVAIDVGDDATPEITGFDRFADTGEAGVALPANAALQIAIWAGTPLSHVTAFTTPALPEGANLFVIATGLLSKLPRETDGFDLLAVGPTGTIGFIKQNPTVFALHASPDAGAVDIFAGAAELVDNISFGELSGALQVPPASYTLTLKDAVSGADAATVSTPTLAAGERYLAIASGFAGSQSITLLAYADNFSLGIADAQIRVVHASPDAPPVDVGTANGGVVTAVPDFVNLAFEDASKQEGTTLPVGSLNIGIAATGTTSSVAEFTVNTAGGLRAFAVAGGSFLGTGQAFRLLIVDATNYPWQVAGISPNP